MASLGMAFDPTTVPQDEYEALPAGVYAMQIIDSERIDKDSGDVGLKMTFEVIEGDFERRMYFEYLNIVHSNEKAQNIAHQTLAKIVNASGCGVIEDSDELHHIPMLVTLKPQTDKRDGTVRMRASKFEPYQAAAPAPAPAHRPAPAAARQAPASRPVANAPAARPWGNRAAG